MKQAKKKRYICVNCRKDYSAPIINSHSKMKLCPFCGYMHIKPVKK